MNLERLLQINVAALVVLGSLLLGMGQRSMMLPLLAVAASVVSVCMTDILRLFRLNAMFANIAGILAVVICLSDFFEYHHKAEQLFAVANLLVYLQMILLFQEKNNRLYGHLIVLSLLQVVVASALGLELQFGVMLVLYMFAALSALCFLLFHRELSRHSRNDSHAEDAATDALRAGSSYEELAADLTIRGLLRCIVTMGISTLIIAFSLFH